MQENEFEKQLKKKMEEFRLSPSATVWAKVEKRLDEKKRRKIPFFFLLAAGLITAGYFTFYISRAYLKNSTEVVHTNLKTREVNRTSGLKDSNKLSEEVNIANQGLPDTSVDNKTKHLPYDLNLYKKEKVLKQPKSDVVITGNLNQSKANSRLFEKSSSNNSDQQGGEQNLKDNDTYALNNNPANKPEVAIPAEAIHDSSITSKNIKEEAVKSISPAKIDSIAIKENQPANSREVAIKRVSIYKNPKWKFGITASYGRSKLIENTKQFNGIAPQYLNSSPGTVLNLAVVSKAHPFSFSYAYSFGVIVQRKIMKDGYISSGLNFTHLSSKASVNNKIDSSLIIQTSNDIRSFYAVNGYYQAGSLSTYISNYNFVELPVSLQQYFFQKKQIALSYNAGFSVRQLLSSNTLVYNPNNNVYFSKDDFFRKTQFQLLAGLRVEINTGKNNSVSVGPQFSYSLFNFAKNKNNGNFHFMNYGLQADFLLHKK